MTTRNHPIGVSKYTPKQDKQITDSAFGKSSFAVREVNQRAACRAVADDLEAAATTLSNLPAGANVMPAGIRSNWPEMLRKSRFIVEKTRRSSRPIPSPEQIDKMTQSLDLLWELTPQQRQLVWGRACWIPWAVLGERLARSRTALNRDHRQALLRLIRIKNLKIG